MQIRITGKCFGARRVLGAMSIGIGAGETLALLGPSGIGKTTLIRIVAGLDTDFDGSVSNAGRIAMVFQTPRLLPWRTVRQNLTLATGIDGPVLADALGAVGLDDRADAYPATLSLGQQRRVALARAFALSPDTLLLDEPFASLDPESALEMESILSSLLAASAARAILVTHDAAEAARLANRAVVLGGEPATIVSDIALGPDCAARGDAERAALTAALRDAQRTAHAG